PRGKRGFGYDPIFIPKGCTKTMAQFKDYEKNLSSNRPEALHQFKVWLNEHGLLGRTTYLMQLLLLSDTHGLTKEITEIKNRHHVDLVIHCGDSELPSDASVLKNIEVVKGNCDRDSNYLDEKIIELTPGTSCYVTHGHL